MFLSIFGDLPQLIAKDVGSLMELLFGLIVFSHVRVVVGELVEVDHELAQHFLLVV